jgi:hypothetical protein
VEKFFSELIISYGPLALGWAIAALLGWRVFADAASNRISSKDVLDDFRSLVDAYHAAVVDNTRVTERLALLIEERTRRRP